MKAAGKHHRIVWLVRILTVTGLAMVVTTTGLVGWTLAGMRHERAAVTAEEGRLDQASRLLRDREAACRAEIQSTLDETSPAPAKEPSAAADFAALIRGQRTSLAIPAVSVALAELSGHAAHLAEIADRAHAWRASYLPVWEDLREQRTLGRVRQLLTQLRTARATVAGRRRLDQAIDHRRWRQATGADAAHLAREILLETGRQQSAGTTDFDGQLAEFARLVELLGGEEQFDSLNDLKDNKIKPVLDALHRALTVLDFHGVGSASLRPEAVEKLKSALFGEGSRSDEVHQIIEVGRGGLFTLRRDALALRREREKLKGQLAAEGQHIDAAHAAFLRSAQSRFATLTRQMEQSLADGWNQLLLFSSGCATLFFWLAWNITRGIDGQVHIIEQARAEAEQENTERRLAEEALRASSEKFHQLADNIADVFWIAAADLSVIHYLSPAFEHIFGRPAAALYADPGLWKGMILPADLAGLVGEFQAIAEGATGFDVEYRIVRPDGDIRWVRSTCSRVPDADGRLIRLTGVLSDITERKQSEAELHSAHQQLIQTSRLAGMAEVATGVLHNVGNVLNSVNVSATLVGESLKQSKIVNLGRVVALLESRAADLGAFLTTDPQGRKLVGYLAQVHTRLLGEQSTALSEVVSLRHNIEHIKQIVSLQQQHAKFSGISETLQIADLVEDTLRMNAPSLAQHQLTVVREFDPVPAVSVDRHTVLQILVNLVRNARQACDATTQPEKTLTIRVFNGSDSVKVAVADNGIGIAAENLNRVFNHGFTTKAEGHGFGLHSSALAAKEMGGALRAESQGPGHGSTFTLELPVAHPRQN